jgi:hypothetical protein
MGRDSVRRLLIRLCSALSPLGRPQTALSNCISSSPLGEGTARAPAPWHSGGAACHMGEEAASGHASVSTEAALWLGGGDWRESHDGAARSGELTQGQDTVGRAGAPAWEKSSCWRWHGRLGPQARQVDMVGRVGAPAWEKSTCWRWHVRLGPQARQVDTVGRAGVTWTVDAARVCGRGPQAHQVEHRAFSTE